MKVPLKKKSETSSPAREKSKATLKGSGGTTVKARAKTPYSAGSAQVTQAGRSVFEGELKQIDFDLQDLKAQARRMRVIVELLKKEYPDAHCSLVYGSPFQLLVATILSAQCTDERVNRVTPALFERFSTPQMMAGATLTEIEELIRSTGFFRSKALSISMVSKALVSQYQGQVPADRDALTQLRGVGRKTANVVLGEVYGQPSLVVDTHVGRLSRRMGFTKQTDAVKVEYQMMEVVERDHWTLYAHLLIQHGRRVCTARRAECSECFLASYCPKVGVKA